MESMLSKHDRSVLSEPGIDVSFAIRRVHEDLYPHIFDYNFTFEQQNDFYFQWYSEAIEKASFERKHEFRDFYRVKAMHETMWSRQKETALVKAKLFPGYFSYPKMIDKIFRPTWFNILGEDSTILFDKEEFLKGLSNFIARFDVVDITPEPLPLAKIADASGYMFTLRMDYVADIGLTQDTVGPIEQRFPYVAYRAKLTDPEEQWHGMPPMEYFDMCYMAAENFSDKRLLHHALEERLSRDYNRQLQDLRVMSEYRTGLIERQKPLREERLEQARAAWEKVRVKALGVRYVEWLKLDEDDEFKKEVEIMKMDQAVKMLLPLREESLDPLPRE